MKYLLLTLLVFALVVPAFAREIALDNTYDTLSNPTSVVSDRFEPVFGGRSETEMSNDNGVAHYHWSGGIAGFAGKFIAPYDLYVTAVRLTCYNSTGRNYYIDILGEDSGVPGKPDRNNSLISGYETFWQGSVSGDTWIRFDLATKPFISSGDPFFPMSDDSIDGLDNAPQDNQAPGPDDSAWWYFGGTSWTDYDLFGAMLIRVVVNDDVAAPYANDQNPADGDSGVAIDADILFDIQDADIGVDSSTITTDSVVVTDDTKAAISGTLTVDDADPNDVHVTFDPDSDFGNGVTVTVTVSPSGNEITDDLGNVMAEDSWSFEVIPVGVESASLGSIKAEFK